MLFIGGALMYDCIIIGGGPAGLSASFYTIRAGLKTLIFAKDTGALEKAHVENYFGFEKPVKGTELIAASRENALRLGGEISENEVTGVTFVAEGFVVSDAEGGRYLAKTVVIANGKSLSKPSVPGLQKFVGAGVSRCAVCDGFFFRGKRVGVLGSGSYARAEASELSPLAASVTVFTNGRAPDFESFKDISVNTAKISGVLGEDSFLGLVTEAGEITLDGMFIAEGVASADALAAKLGLLTDNGMIAVDSGAATNIPGVFAAGDCTGTPYQVSVAVGEGAKAGLSVIEFVRKNK